MPIPYEEWLAETEEALHILCAESGADREVDFDFEGVCERVYEKARVQEENIEGRGVYYAHSMKIYGTPEEKQELLFLRRLFPDLQCPNTTLSLGSNMQSYIDYVRHHASMVIVSEYKGHIGRGVYLEISEAMAYTIPVFVLRDERLLMVKRIKIENPWDWAVYYATLYTNGLEKPNYDVK